MDKHQYRAEENKHKYKDNIVVVFAFGIFLAFLICLCIVSILFIKSFVL